MPANSKKKGLFAKIETGPDAAKMVRDAANGFFVVAALQGAVAIFFSTPGLGGDAVVIALLAGMLLKWRSRIAAVLLLLISGVEAGVTLLNRLGATSLGGQNVFLAAIVLIVAARAVEATFKLHGRFRDQLVQVS